MISGRRIRVADLPLITSWSLCYKLKTYHLLQVGRRITRLVVVLHIGHQQIHSTRVLRHPKDTLNSDRYKLVTRFFDAKKRLFNWLSALWLEVSDDVIEPRSHVYVVAWRREFGFVGHRYGQTHHGFLRAEKKTTLGTDQPPPLRLPTEVVP